MVPLKTQAFSLGAFPMNSSHPTTPIDWAKPSDVADHYAALNLSEQAILALLALTGASQPCLTRYEPERRVYFHPGMSPKRGL